MFGHTHKAVSRYADDLTILNPGSLSFRVQDGRKPQLYDYGAGRGGKAHYTVNYL